MIEHADPDQFSHLAQALRDSAVLGGRCRIAAGVVMDGDEGGRVRVDRGFEDFAWMNERGRQRPRPGS